MTSGLLNCSHNRSKKRGGVSPSIPFYLTRLSIKETFSEVLGIPKGQHMGGRSSEGSYNNHWRFNTATNSITSSKTQEDVPGLSKPRESTHGDSAPKLRKPPP